MYLYATFSKIYGKFVCFLPIYRNSFFKDSKGLSTTAIFMGYRYKAKYLSAK
jgi:hypothetical protein